MVIKKFLGYSSNFSEFLEYSILGFYHPIKDFGNVFLAPIVNRCYSSRRTVDELTSKSNPLVMRNFYHSRNNSEPFFYSIKYFFNNKILTDNNYTGELGVKYMKDGEYHYVKGLWVGDTFIVDDKILFAFRQFGNKVVLLYDKEKEKSPIIKGLFRVLKEKEFVIPKIELDPKYIPVIKDDIPIEDFLSYDAKKNLKYPLVIDQQEILCRADIDNNAIW